MKYDFTADGNSIWVDLRGIDNRASLLSIAGAGSFGGGTIKLDVSFEDDKTSNFLIGTGLTADGAEAINIGGIKWARLNLAGSTTPTVTGYINF